MWRRMLAGLMGLFLAGVVHAAVPDVMLHDMDGKPRNAKEYIGQGKWTIVVIWAHDCLICDSSIHHMSEFHAAHHDKDATVLGVSIDGMDKLDLARGFVAKHKLPFSNLVAEPEEEVIGRFGGGRFIGTPTHYFYDPVGRIVGRKVGPLSGADIEAFIEAFNNSPYAQQPAKTQ